MAETWGSALRVPGGEFWWLLQDAMVEIDRGKAAHDGLLELGAKCAAASRDAHNQLTVLMALARALGPADVVVKAEPVDLVERVLPARGWMPLG